MHIIVCLDDRNGTLFNKRRLSSDRAVCQRVADAGGRLWMNGYSAPLFQGVQVCVDENFLEKAGPGDVCFVENVDIAPYARQVETVTVYRWNRAYPSDTKFPLELFAHRWRLEHTVDFPGNSHETITEERYRL